MGRCDTSIQPFFNQDGGAGAVGNGPSKQGGCNNSAPRAQLITGRR
jgi:hypothetical protein